MWAGTVAGRNYTLDDVEDYLRKPTPYKEDPRLHACIVCASISCPNVLREAFVAERIEEQMTAQVCGTPFPACCLLQAHKTLPAFM